MADVNGDTGNVDGNGNWFDSISDQGIRDSVKGIEGGLDGLAKGYLDGQASYSELQTKYEGLEKQLPIIPADPSKYELQKPEGLLDRDEAVLDRYRGVAHEIGLTQTQAERLMAFNAEENAIALKLMKEENEAKSKKAEEALKEEWGEKFDLNYELAERAVTALGGDDLINTLESLGLTRNPVVIKLFHTIAMKLGEDNLIPGSERGGKELPTMSSGRRRLTFKSMDK